MLNVHIHMYIYNGLNLDRNSETSCWIFCVILWFNNFVTINVGFMYILTRTCTQFGYPTADDKKTQPLVLHCQSNAARTSRFKDVSLTESSKLIILNQRQNEYILIIVRIFSVSFTDGQT